MKLEIKTPDSGRRTSNDAQPSGFTLIEVMLVVALLSLIIVALMAVFNSTQSAFRASVTQTDVLEGGRATMDLIGRDLKVMSPSLGASNGAVNFYVNTNAGFSPLIQPMTASLNNLRRTNILENFFILSRGNQTWTGVGYVVDPASTNGINSLYRFSMSTNVAAADPWRLFYYFTNAVASNSFTAMSHLIDGVVGLRVRAYDTNGFWMARGYTNAQNIFFQPQALGENGFYMFGDTLPASVEVEMATLEDRALQQAGTWLNNSAAQSNYLAQQAGKVHIFRQRISIPNVDPAAYQ